MENDEITDKIIQLHFHKWTIKQIKTIINEIDPNNYLSREDLTINKLIKIAIDNPEVRKTFIKNEVGSKLTRKFMLAVQNYITKRDQIPEEFQGIGPKTD